MYSEQMDQSFSAFKAAEKAYQLHFDHRNSSRYSAMKTAVRSIAPLSAPVSLEAFMESHGPYGSEGLLMMCASWHHNGAATWLQERQAVSERTRDNFRRGC